MLHLCRLPLGSLGPLLRKLRCDYPGVCCVSYVSIDRRKASWISYQRLLPIEAFHFTRGVLLCYSVWQPNPTSLLWFSTAVLLPSSPREPRDLLQVYLVCCFSFWPWHISPENEGMPVRCQPDSAVSRFPGRCMAERARGPNRGSHTRSAVFLRVAGHCR
jgi:hypothetical protein